MRLLVIFDASERCSDLLYATGFKAPDPILYLEFVKQKFLYVSTLEFDRAKAVCGNRMKVIDSDNKSPSELLSAFSHKKNIRKILTPYNFPAGLALELNSKGFSVIPLKRAFFPSRQIKTKDEIAKIAGALGIAEAAMLKAEKAIGESSVGENNILLWQGQPLSSEIIKCIINTDIAGSGAVSKDTIVACGVRAAEPHNSGSGPLRAGQPIIIDIFPRSANGYWGDITRTFIKWKASPRFIKMYQTVKDAAEKAMEKIKKGAIAADIHKIAFEYIRSQGYKTGKMRGKNCGFFHGLGHGVGLDIHEYPALSPKNNRPLKSGNVITVEPGLYYPDFGGIRIEDIVVVKNNSAENLTRYHKNPLIA